MSHILSYLIMFYILLSSETKVRFPIIPQSHYSIPTSYHLVNPWNDHKKVQICRDGQVNASHYSAL